MVDLEYGQLGDEYRPYIDRRKEDIAGMILTNGSVTNYAKQYVSLWVSSFRKKNS